MKAQTTVQLDSKEIRRIIAEYFGIDIEKVISTKYNFAIIDVPIEELEKKIKKGE